MNNKCSECDNITPHDSIENQFRIDLRDYSNISFNHYKDDNLDVFLCNDCHRKWISYMPKPIFSQEFRETILKYAIIKRERDLYLEKLENKDVEAVVIME